MRELKLFLVGSVPEYEFENPEILDSRKKEHEYGIRNKNKGWKREIVERGPSGGPSGGGLIASYDYSHAKRPKKNMGGKIVFIRRPQA